MTQLLSDTTVIDLTRALAGDGNVRPGVLELPGFSVEQRHEARGRARRPRTERLARRHNRYRDLGLP